MKVSHRITRLATACLITGASTPRRERAVRVRPADQNGGEPVVIAARAAPRTPSFAVAMATALAAACGDHAHELHSGAAYAREHARDDGLGRGRLRRHPALRAITHGVEPRGSCGV